MFTFPCLQMDSFEQTFDRSFVINGRDGYPACFIDNKLLRLFAEFQSLTNIEGTVTRIIDRDTLLIGQLDVRTVGTSGKYIKFQLINPKGTWTLETAGDITNIYYTPTGGPRRKPFKAGTEASSGSTGQWRTGRTTADSESNGEQFGGVYVAMGSDPNPDTGV